MKRLKFLPLLLVLLLVITSIPMKITASAETIMTEESGETEQEDVPYIIGIDYEKEPEESERYVQPEEFGDTEEEYGDVEETKPSDEASSPYESEYSATYIITEDGITVHEKTEDSETITEWNNNGNATKEELINDVNKFLDNNDSREESYTPSFSTKKDNSSSSKESKNEENSDYTIIESNMVKGSYKGINWTYDPINKKLTFTPGSSTIIPWVSKDDYSSLPWMAYKDEVEKISVQDGITSIYANNFRDFTKLTKVYTSGAVNQISSYAFTGCDNIKQFVINCYNLDWSFDSDLLFNINHDAVFVCNYSTDVNSTFHKLYYEGKYVLNTNQMDDANMCDVEAINQNIYAITSYKTESHPGTWGYTACVVSSYSMLVERFAANNEFDSLSGSYDMNTGVEILKEVSNKAGSDNVINSAWNWQYQTYTRSYRMFVKDNTPLSITTTNIYYDKKESCPSTKELEKKLQSLLSTHPEGVIVYTHYLNYGVDDNHAVLVTDYSNGYYTVINPGGGVINKVSNFSKIFNSTNKDGYAYDYTKAFAYVVR